MQREVINKQVEAFLLFIASISAVIIYLSRIGLDNDVMIVLKSVSLSYLIILFPNFFFKYLNKHKVKIFLSQPIVSFLVILLLIFSGFVKNIIGFDLSYIYFIFGFYLFLSFLFSNLLKLKLTKQNWVFLIITLIFSFFITAAYYSNHYTHPLMLEKIINGSWAHRDILFHSSISGMFKTYFFRGTGLDGFVPHYYHSLSHYVFGLLSELLNINTLTFYSIVFPIIVTPMFFMFFLFATLELSEFFAKINNFKSTNANNIYLWILLYIFFALPIERSFLLEKYHYILSQSYAFALLLFFFIIYLFFFLINTQSFYTDIKYKKIQTYLFATLLFLLSISASYSKVSFIYVLTICGSYIFLRFKLYKYFFYCLMFVFWIIFIIFFYFNLLVFFEGLDLFPKDKHMSHRYSFKEEFFYAYISIFFIILKLISLKIFSIKTLIYNLKNNKIPDIELMFILIFSLYIISYQYFKGIQLYISYILIIAHLNLIYDYVFNKKAIYDS